MGNLCFLSKPQEFAIVSRNDILNIRNQLKKQDEDNTRAFKEIKKIKDEIKEIPHIKQDTIDITTRTRSSSIKSLLNALQ